jgi:hypothetical protein
MYTKPVYCIYPKGQTVGTLSNKCNDCPGPTIG